MEVGKEIAVDWSIGAGLELDGHKDTCSPLVEANADLRAGSDAMITDGGDKRTHCRKNESHGLRSDGVEVVGVGRAFILAGGKEGCLHSLVEDRVEPMSNLSFRVLRQGTVSNEGLLSYLIIAYLADESISFDQAKVELAVELHSARPFVKTICLSELRPNPITHLAAELRENADNLEEYHEYK